MTKEQEVILNKLEKQKEKAKPALSASEMENIYKIAEQMDRMDKQIQDEKLQWSEQDLIDLLDICCFSGHVYGV